MKQSSMMKKTIATFILTAFLSASFSAAEAAPSRKVYPYPDQQQSQQNSRPAAQQPRPSSPRPSMQQPRPASPRPSMQQPKPVTQRTTIQQPKPATQRTTMQQPRPVTQRTTVQQPRPVTQRTTVQQPKHTEASRERLRPKAHEPKQNAVRPKTDDPKPNIAKPKAHEPKQNVAKPKIHDSKPNIAKPKAHDAKQSVSKPKTHRPEYRKHSKPGPRKDLLRPPVQRTYENMHVWRRAPRAPKDHWWNYRPAHGWGRYSGYYSGIYYTDVVSALLAAEIIHSTYVTEPASVIYYAEDSTRAFIPKEAVKYKGHHYLVFSDIGNTMEDAQQFCESMGGHLAEVGDEKMNERMYRLINDSGYDNEYFEKFGHYRMIPNEPVTYVTADQESNSEEDEVFYGLYYWNYKNLTEDGTTDGTGGNAFVCEWDA